MIQPYIDYVKTYIDWRSVVALGVVLVVVPAVVVAIGGGRRNRSAGDQTDTKGKDSMAVNMPRRILLALASAVVLVAVTAAVVVMLTRPAGTVPTTPTVPAIANIKRPNVACTPAVDRKIGLGDDLSGIQWFGWLDGKQADMPLGQALAQRIAGHTLVDAWYCPPRANW